MRSWQIDGDPSKEILDAIADILGAGGIALLPTDTIYGLHGIAGDAGVAGRIAELKGRADDKPFVVIAANVRQLKALGLLVPDALESLWPAPLTAILERDGGPPLGVRVPDCRWLRDLLDRTGPLISTSANRSGATPITTPADLPDDLRSALDAILDAGVREAKPSALVDLTGAEPRWIREGNSLFAQKLRKTLRKSL